MKKMLALLMAFLLCAPAFAEEETIVTLFHNKLEIGAQLEAFAAAYSEATPGVTVQVETLSNGTEYSAFLKARQQGGLMPDIFVIEGLGNYNVWKDYCADLSDEPWVPDTDVAFVQDGVVYGFPVSIEGFGLGYNTDILAAAGIDPAGLTTFSAVREAFEKLDGMKDELGLDAVVSMGISVANGISWSSGNHSFSVYLGGSMDPSDTTVIDLFNRGEVDKERLAQYAEYVNLLFDYADQDTLVFGSYDQHLSAFASGKTAFIHQGNWIDPNLQQADVGFSMGYISHCFTDEETTGLYLFAPSYYAVNAQAPEANIQAAKDFLSYMATTAEGAQYMVEQAGMVPAYKSIGILPAGDFSRALVTANAEGGNYAVRFAEMPEGFGMNTLGPIYELLALDIIDTTDFCALVANAIAAAAK